MQYTYRVKSSFMRWFYAMYLVTLLHLHRRSYSIKIDSIDSIDTNERREAVARASGGQVIE